MTKIITVIGSSCISGSEIVSRIVRETKNTESEILVVNDHNLPTEESIRELFHQSGVNSPVEIIHSELLDESIYGKLQKDGIYVSNHKLERTGGSKYTKKSVKRKKNKKTHNRKR